MRRQIGAAIHALAVKVDPDSHVDDSIEALVDALNKATGDLDSTTGVIERATDIRSQMANNGRVIPIGTYNGVEWLAVPRGKISW